jgi:hypothetical protein
MHVESRDIENKIFTVSIKIMQYIQNSKNSISLYQK